jgi:Helix-turn-helix domain
LVTGHLADAGTVEPPAALSAIDDLDSLPVERPEVGAGAQPPQDFSWTSLVAATIHPVKVAIVEALLWVHEPLSATELTELFGHPDYNLDVVLYHLKGLIRLEVISVNSTRRVRGAREKYLFFR